MKTLTAILIGGIISSVAMQNAFAQVISISSSGSDSKIYMLGDKIKIKSRLSSQSGQQAGQMATNNMAAYGNAQMNDPAAMKAAKEKRIIDLKHDIENIEGNYKVQSAHSGGIKKEMSQGDKDAIKSKKAEIADLESGDGSHAKAQMDEMNNPDKKAIAEKEFADKLQDKSMSVEIVRFDESKIYKIKDKNYDNKTYDESTLADEKAKRSKGKKPSPLIPDLKNTAITKNIDGENCTLYLGSITVSGMQYGTDSIWVGSSTPVAQQYWKAMKKYNDEVVLEAKEVAEGMFLTNAAYMEKVFALPGLPIKRITTMMGQPSAVAHLTVISPTADDKDFALPEGFKKSK